MKATNKYLAIALLSVGLIPLAFAEPAPRDVPEGIEVIEVVGYRAMPTDIEVITVVGKKALPADLEGIEVITVVAKRIEPSVAGTCVNQALAGAAPASEEANARNANRDAVRQAIRDCIEQAQLTATHS